MYYNNLERKGDVMKLKTWHLFAVIIALFVCSFYVVNLKFDKFYRVNGINNDNRVLIEKYLDKEEQSYLIDNQISIDLFIDYIEYDDFHLQNYQYYNALKDTKRYTNTQEILEVGNSLADRLTYLYNSKATNYAKNLIDNSLELAFLNESTFDFIYLNLYNDMQPLYAEGDYTYIKDTKEYVLRLKSLGVEGIEDLEETFYKLTAAYTKTSLKQLMTAPIDSDVSIVYNPYELSTLVDDHHYIGEYEPKGLLLTQDIPRVRYAMYLQNEAYNALLKMYQDLSKEYSGFLLKDAYVSSQNLEQNPIGFDERQLGLTIDVTKSEIAYQEFENTDISKWLEQHAYEYGFILRYPKNKASITGNSYNPHIYRYVGEALAKTLYESNMTLEEYQSQES